MEIKLNILGWGKKTLAFIIDFLILIPLYYIIAFIIFLSTTMLGGKEFALKFESLTDLVVRILLLLVYFFFLPKQIGNSIGRKILRIEDRFDLFWTWPFFRSKEKDCPRKDLRKDGILKVAPANGKWICPSCKESSLESYDVCSNCGQEVSKDETI